LFLDQHRDLCSGGIVALLNMFNGALSRPERLDRAIAFGAPTFPQADP
jgi:ATP-dependent 26S proteasome regulatory subunit